MTIPSPEDLMREARLMEQAGRLADAVDAYERLLGRAPNLPNSWYNLARLQRRVARPEAALGSYQRALDLGIAEPEEVRLNRGVIFSDDLRRPDQAEGELKAALAINPAYLPALLNLANLAEDRGRRQEALDLYERTLALDPRCWLALARCAGLKRLASADDPLIARLKGALADPGPSPEDRADLGFALGMAMDSCGAYDAAFAAYAEANTVSRESGGVRPAYDRAEQEALVDRLCEVFTPERIMVLRTSSEAEPIFICGMFRSGSTLIEQILAAHPRVTPGGELDLLPHLVDADLAPFPQSMARVDRARIEALAAGYAEAVAGLFPSADVVTDKRPDNFLYLGLIKTLFPRARIVHTRRDPLDNCLSVYFLHLDARMGYALDLLDAGHYLLQERRLMAHWKSLFGEDILDCSYDDLVRAPTPAAARLLEFCGLEWDEACLDFHQLDNAVRTASVWQVREPLHQRSTGRWRNYERHLRPLRAYLDAERR